MRYEWRTHSKGDGSCELEEVPLAEGLGSRGRQFFNTYKYLIRLTVLIYVDK